MDHPWSPLYSSWWAETFQHFLGFFVLIISWFEHRNMLKTSLLWNFWIQILFDSDHQLSVHIFTYPFLLIINQIIAFYSWIISHYIVISNSILLHFNRRMLFSQLISDGILNERLTSLSTDKCCWFVGNNILHYIAIVIIEIIFAFVERAP